MNYLLDISKAMLKRASNVNCNSKPIIISAVRDLLLLAESQLLNGIMVRSATTSLYEQNEPYNVNDLMNSLKNTNRDIKNVLKNIEYLEKNTTMPLKSPQIQKEIAEKSVLRLAQLRDEAITIKDYELADSIENLFSEIGLI